MSSFLSLKIRNLLSISVVGCLGVIGSSCISPAEPDPEKNQQVVESGTFVEKPIKMSGSIRKRGENKGISIDEVFLAQQSGEPLIYDVRDPYFYQKDHIPGAINWSSKNYDSEVQQRDREIQKALASGKKVIVYCFNFMCPEARNVAKKLARRDYSIHVFNAGIDSWRDAGLPLTVPGS